MLTEETAPTGRRDAVLAVMVALGVLCLYLRTLLPHIGGTEDTAKFQYLGAVLGTAHSPGYPLYVLLSHAFSYLPFGTLAYRINFMSACSGAVTAALLFLCIRQLGGHRLIAGAAAVSLATGSIFWGNSVIAEVYTLNAALWTAAVLMLLRWKDSGRDRDLYGATLAVALGLGNHLTILGLFPAALAYLLLSKRPWYRWRTVLSCAGILAAGLCQYGFIWLRTSQHVSYLESQATSLSELVQVMTARRYADLMFHFDARSLVAERLPLLWSTCRLEMGYLGLAAAGLGLLRLRKRPAHLALVSIAVVAVLGLTANVVADAGGFLLPVFATLWLVAAVGLDGLYSATVRHGGRAAGIAVLGFVLALPLWQLRSNFATADHHDEVFESRYFAAMFEQLPPRAAVIMNEYMPEQMLHYGIISKDFKRDGPPLVSASPDAREVEQFLAAGFSVYAFPNVVDQLRSHGFRLTPFQLFGLTLRQYAQDIDDGQLVAVGVSGVELPPELARVLDGRGVRASGAAPVLAIIAVKGANGFTLESVQSPSADLSVSTGETVGRRQVPLPVSVKVSASSEAAAITIDGREEVTAKRGVAIVVFDPDGRVRDRRQFEPEHGFTTELRMGAWPLVQVVGQNACLALGDNAWHDATDVSRGGGVDARVDNFQPFEGSVLFYLASSRPLTPQLDGFYGGCQQPEPCPAIQEPRLTHDTYGTLSPADDRSLASRLVADGLPPTDELSRAAYVYRVEASLNDQGQSVAFWLNYNGVPSRAFARAHTDRRAPARAAVCAWTGTGPTQK